MKWDERSRQLDATQAQQLHNGAVEIGETLIWRIYDRSEEGRFVARPIMVSQQQSTTVEVHLQAETLEELRKLLPGDLHRIPKGAEIDPDALECWV